MTEDARHRARSWAELGKIKRQLFRGDEGALSIKSYRPRPTDIIISSYQKCGTTWLQQMFHTLRTRGDMDFPEISTVVPWIEAARSLTLDLEAPQKAEPRGFKCHLPYYAMPKGSRYVVSLRDPKDVLVSSYRFDEGWFFEPGYISIADFFRGWLQSARRGLGYYEHLMSWWEQRANPDVLLLTYEGMVADPTGTARRLAAFCGIELDNELLALTLEHSSLPFMLQHRDKFDEFMIRRLSEQRCNLPPGGDSVKVRKGVVGGYRNELTKEIDAAMDAIWSAFITPKLGFEDYAALESRLGHPK